LRNEIEDDEVDMRTVSRQNWIASKKFIASILFFMTLVAAMLQAQVPGAMYPNLGTELEFTPVETKLGTMMQGETRTVVLQGKNVSDKTVKIEIGMSQNIGSENFEFPKSIKPGEEFKVKFDFSSAFLVGSFMHNIILSTPEGTNYLAHLSGSVTTPVSFSTPLLDLGYYTAGQSAELKTYAWSPLGKAFKLTLNPERAKEWKVSFKEVKLDTKDPQNVKPGGSTPGWEITLVPQNLSKKSQSIRELIDFQTDTWPGATPEVRVIGYWK